MDLETQEAVNGVIKQLCELIEKKMNGCSAEDHEQLPRLVEALAKLIQQ